MNVYKVTFSNNEVQACFYVCESSSNYSSYYCHFNEGSLEFAIIKAITLDNAFDIASGISAEITRGLVVAA